MEHIAPAEDLTIDPRLTHLLSGDIAIGDDEATH
jgi:hypothetical protein